MDLGGDPRVDRLLALQLDQEPGSFRPSCNATDSQFLLRALEVKNYEVVYRTKGMGRGKRRVEVRYEDLLVGSGESSTFELALARAGLDALMGKAPGAEDIAELRRQAITRLYPLVTTRASLKEFVRGVEDFLSGV